MRWISLVKIFEYRRIDLIKEFIYEFIYVPLAGDNNQDSWQYLFFNRRLRSHGPPSRKKNAILESKMKNLLNMHIYNYY